MSLQALHSRPKLLPSYGYLLEEGLGFFIRRVIRVSPALLRVASAFDQVQLRGTRHSRSSLTLLADPPIPLSLLPYSTQALDLCTAELWLVCPSTPGNCTKRSFPSRLIQTPPSRQRQWKGPHLSAGEVGLQPRLQATQAADRVRAVMHGRGVSGRG